MIIFSFICVNNIKISLNQTCNILCSCTRIHLRIIRPVNLTRTTFFSPHNYMPCNLFFESKSFTSCTYIPSEPSTNPPFYPFQTTINNIILHYHLKYRIIDLLKSHLIILIHLNTEIIYSYPV